jgi:pimeloyl-ACP methyl ester carboxylesterase
MAGRNRIFPAGKVVIAIPSATGQPLPMIHRALLVLLCAAAWTGSPSVHAKEPATIPYGENQAAGHTFEVNGIPLYYEVYGEGEPMLLIHPNGGSIRSMAPQIEFFAQKYKVIAADSRGFGKSPIGEGKLTYESMTADLEALLDHLDIKKETIIGWSDGGIIGLLMAIDHPDRITKLAVMGANLNPEGVYEWARIWVGRQTQSLAKMREENPGSKELQDMGQVLDLMENQPHIPLADLAKITSPVLVMAGDKDIIRTEHTLQIFEALPHAQMCIFPGATHQISHRDPERFNRTVDEFLSRPFSRPDSKHSME